MTQHSEYPGASLPEYKWRAMFEDPSNLKMFFFAGMQSAALGFLLAQKHFVDPMVAVPSAVSVVFMALGGAALAVFWRNRPVKVLQ